MYTLFFYNHRVYKHHQAEIWSKIKHHVSTTHRLKFVNTTKKKLETFLGGHYSKNKINKINMTNCEMSKHVNKI